MFEHVVASGDTVQFPSSCLINCLLCTFTSLSGRAEDDGSAIIYHAKQKMYLELYLSVGAKRGVLRGACELHCAVEAWMYYGKLKARQTTSRSCRRLRIAACQTDRFRSLRQLLKKSIPSTRKPVRRLHRWQDRNRMDNIDSRCNRFIAPLFSCDATPAAWRLLHLKGLILLSRSSIDLLGT